MHFDYILGVFGTIIFITGFFPIPQNVGTFNNEPPLQIANISLEKYKHYSTNISKTVLVVVDALRLDFVSSENMPLTIALANNGCFCTVQVQTPTVTLPRIKALTTGSVPQFMDIVINLANAQALKDSVIHSARKQQKKINFYGDDTWLTLFPHEFDRFEGTHSFFVRDFVEVDNNVTRNVNLELYKDDWDILILHYLGLDHIGHVHGPFSPLVPHKLKEMDQVISKIHQFLSSKSETFLLMVTADHGMKDSGGHGGSTFSETHVPLIVIGQDCNNVTLLQTDIPVNLAILLGLDIPSIAVGQVRTDMFNFILEKQLYVLRYNLLLLKQKSNICDLEFNLATQLHKDYLEGYIENNALNALKLYGTCVKLLSESLTKSSVDQNILHLLIGILLLGNVLLTLLTNIFISTFSSFKVIGIIHLVVCLSYLLTSSLFLASVVIIISLISIITCIYIRGRDYITFQNRLTLFLFFQPLTFISSSFVEEEHQFWYFFNLLLMSVQLLHNMKEKNVHYSFTCFVILVYLRFIRRLNSTGDQWASYPDLSDWFLKYDNYLYYILFTVVSIIILYFVMHNFIQCSSKIKIYSILQLICILAFKLNETVFLGQVCWLSILCHFILFNHHFKVLTWIFIGALLLKSYNIILLPFCLLFHITLKRFIKNIYIFVLSHIYMGNMLFFAQGQSNSLASVDVSVGYVGLSSYQPFVVIIQVLFHTYVFPVLCLSLVLRHFPAHESVVWKIIFCNRFYTFFIVAIITFLQRHHLFIWSVFAPKLFIEFVHVLFLLSVYFCYLSIQSFQKYFHRNKQMLT